MDNNLTDDEKLRIIDEKIYQTKQEKEYENFKIKLDKLIDEICKKYNLSKDDVYNMLLELNGLRKH